MLVLPRHTFTFHRMAEEAGQPLDAAIVIGVDPLTLLASQAIVPIDHDELEIAGALQGRPLPVVKCLTSDIRVPAEAEIVIEGRFLPGVREPEGPFGEFPQYYGTARQPRGDGGRRRHAPQGRDLPHHRRRRAGASAARRHPERGDAAHASAAQFPERARRASVAGRHHALPSLCQDQEDARRAQGKNVILGAFAGSFDLKHVIVVDEDVDIHNPTEVEWAVATRFQADRDLVIVPESQGSKLDPSNRDGVGAKMGLDATKPLAAPR